MFTPRSITLATIALASIFNGAHVADATIGSRRVLEQDRDSKPDFYVATTGSDANDCRARYSPCLTISGAQEKLRAELVKPNGRNRKWLVQIAGGTYPLYRMVGFSGADGDPFVNQMWESPLEFRAADSGGSEINRVIWQGAPGEKIVISGGYEVAGFTDIGGGLWRSGVITHLRTGRWKPHMAWAGANQDVRRLRPRWPAETGPEPTIYATVASKSSYGALTTKTNQFVSSEAMPASFSQQHEMEFFGMRIWSGSNLDVLDINTATKTVRTTSWVGTTINTMSTGANGAPMFLDNSLDSLGTQDGSFYIDRRPDEASDQFDGRILYNPLPSETDPDSFKLTIPITDRLMTVSNTIDGVSKVEHITFKNIEFAHTDTRNQVFDEPGGPGGIGLAPAIAVAGADDIVFDGVTVRNLGAQGITCGSDTNRCTVINSIGYDLGGGFLHSGTQVEGSDDLNGSGPISSPWEHNMFANPSFANPTTDVPAGANWENLGPSGKTVNGVTVNYASPSTGVDANGIPYVDIVLRGTNGASATSIEIRGGTVFPIKPGYVMDCSGYVAKGPGSVALGTSLVSNAGITGRIISSSGSQSSSQSYVNGTGQCRKTGTELNAIATANLGTAGAVSSSGVAITPTDTAQVQPTLLITVPANQNVTGVVIRFGYPYLRHGTYWRRTKPAAEGPVTNVLFRNNVGRYIGQWYIGATPINAKSVQDAEIAYNDIRYSYANGITMGYVGKAYVSGDPLKADFSTEDDPNFPSNTCSRVRPKRGRACRITHPSELGLRVTATNLKAHHNVLQDMGHGLMSDFGAFHVTGNQPGSEVYENVIANVHTRKTAQGIGIYLDQGASNIKVYKNTIVGTNGPCLFLNPGVDDEFYNNVCKNTNRATTGGSGPAAFPGTLFSMGNMYGLSNSSGGSGGPLPLGSDPNAWQPPDRITNIGVRVECNIAEWVEEGTSPRMSGQGQDGAYDVNGDGTITDGSGGTPDEIGGGPSNAYSYSGYIAYDNNRYIRRSNSATYTTLKPGATVVNAGVNGNIDTRTMRSLTEPFNAAPFDPQAHTWDGWRTAPPAAYYGSAAQAKDVNSVWATTGDDQTYTGSYPKFIPDQKPPGNCWSDFDPNLAGVTDGNVRIGMIPTQIFPYPQYQADPPAGGNLQ